MIDFSMVANIVLSLLILFQWYKNHSREEAVKNGVLAVHGMISRLNDPRGQDILDSLDGTLATLGTRKPFVLWGDSLIESVMARFRKIETSHRITASPLRVGDFARVEPKAQAQNSDF